MRVQQGMALLGALVALAGCGSGSQAALETDEQKASYAIGADVGRSLASVSGKIDQDALVRGLQDAIAERDLALPQEELQAAMQRFSMSLHEDQQRERTEQAEKNGAEGEAYRQQNAAREGVETTASGLQYEVLQEGSGPTPGPENQVTIHYRGTLVDGTEFDSSYGRGEPATFGVTGVIPGFSEGLQLMNVGSRYRFVIPGDLAYGDQGAGDAIGPDATLVFEVELLSIE